MDQLADRRCVPCTGGVPPLKGEALRELHGQVPEWKVVDEHHLERSWKLPDFKTALEFTNRIGELAEQEGHHPEIRLGWGEVRVELYTHKVKGLTESDFILAAKIDRIPVPGAAPAD